MGHHKRTRQQRPFVIGEEVEPITAQGWSTDTIVDIQEDIVIGHKGWKLPANQLKRVLGSLINKQIAKGRKNEQSMVANI